MFYFLKYSWPLRFLILDHIQPKRKKEKIDRRLAFLILFSNGLIAKGNIRKVKAVRYLNMRYWIFKYSFIWIRILCYLLDSISLNKNFKKRNILSTCFLRFEFADQSNDLALFYSSRFRKTSMILPQRCQYLLHY